MVVEEFEDIRNHRSYACTDITVRLCDRQPSATSVHSATFLAQADLEMAIRKHMKMDEKTVAKFYEEIAQIKNAVVLEQQERERHDHELAAALNRFIAKLQASLHIVNSSDIE